MFERIRTIKGRQYRYREKRWREGKKMRSKSYYVGPVDWHHRADDRQHLWMPEVEAGLKKAAEMERKAAAAQKAHREELNAKYGVPLGPLASAAPVEKQTAASPKESGGEKSGGLEGDKSADAK